MTIRAEPSCLALPRIKPRAQTWHVSPATAVPNSVLLSSAIAWRRAVATARRRTGAFFFPFFGHEKVRREHLWFLRQDNLCCAPFLPVKLSNALDWIGPNASTSTRL